LAAPSFAGSLQLDGDSSNVVDRASAAAFGTAKYDLSLTPVVEFKDDFSLKFISGAIVGDTTSTIYVGGAEASQSIDGAKKDHAISHAALVGAPDAATFCQLNSAAIKLSDANISCAAGSDAASVKITVPMTVAYKIQGSLALDVAAMKEANSAYSEPLLKIKLGATDVADSMTILPEAADMQAGSAGGDVASAGFSGANADRVIDLSYELPFKGTNFQSQRSSVIKLVALVRSL
jgi:hypothetical protein